MAIVDVANKPITPERLEQLSQAVEDGWPIKQIVTTYNTSWGTLRKYFPDYRGLDLKHASSLGIHARRMNKQIRKAGYAKHSAPDERQPSYS